jgi:exodeoxyribonuclease VII small subunit
MKKAKNYSQVLQELEETLEKMNRGEITIDNLEAEVKSAAEKITFLRRKLKATEAEITKILQDIDNEEPID